MRLGIQRNIVLKYDVSSSKMLLKFLYRVQLPDHAFGFQSFVVILVWLF